MNYLDKLAKNIEFNGKKQKVSNHKSFLALSVVGVAIGGAALALFTKNCSREAKKNVTDNLEDNNGNIKKDIDENASIVEDINLNRDEIEDTLKNVGEESIGDVGIAMEHALEDDYDEKQNEDKN
ncbi:hypothetical protein [Clostridium tagluense]|uniref:Uncharacterized protein n=1 Tax=Clostridium tagluense TaxID=360422 RepID=A0A401UTH5_9CLOT|nr:hypothetical protein [Clostridium tagluense]GCD12758.1 hypothetical protein Ctaglu_43810 [Clostridium tagluense]